MTGEVPHLGAIDTIMPAPWRSFGSTREMMDGPFVPAVGNFYRTCTISRASPTMSLATDAFLPGVLQSASCS